MQKPTSKNKSPDFLINPATERLVSIELSGACRLLYSNMRLHENFDDYWIHEKICDLIGGILHIVLATPATVSPVPAAVNYLVHKGQDIGTPYTNYDTLATMLVRCVSECLLGCVDNFSYEDIKYVAMCTLNSRATVKLVTTGDPPGLRDLHPKGA